ncbi:hypothetical protein N7501_006193 [Penicillium viridicatum]|nr:hypothetical protein N7501_006193 [Penicillium viridicatum]
MHYLIIDEKSMMRLDMLFWIEQRGGENFTHCRDQWFGRLSDVLKPLFSATQMQKSGDMQAKSASNFTPLWTASA